MNLLLTTTRAITQSVTATYAVTNERVANQQFSTTFYRIGTVDPKAPTGSGASLNTLNAILKQAYASSYKQMQTSIFAQLFGPKP